ncbi:MAG: hypothetical protein M1831_001532 [Alyxoria varia]|nr:MAG: hypothetical protein M1831_001532 [Alyxoria varia]
MVTGANPRMDKPIGGLNGASGSSRWPFNVTSRASQRYLLIVIIAIAALVVVLYHTHDRGLSGIPTYLPKTKWGSAGKGSKSKSSGRCMPIFNPEIDAPPAADVKALWNFWLGLKDLFDDNAPAEKIEHPSPEATGDMPMKEKLHTLVQMGEGSAITSRKSHSEVVSNLPDYLTDTFTGRGVVMLAGGKYSEYAATSLNILRLVGSSLPVEVWVGDESEELDGWCDELAQQRMACRRLSDYVDMKHFEHPYQWKIFTILFSGFEDVLFLDADAFPLVDPEPIFDSEVYLKNGAIIWPDYWGNTESSWTPFITRNESRATELPEGKSAESGQLFWNKKMHWKLSTVIMPLLLATYYNYHGPHFYYSLLNSGWAGWGDKDTFSTALRALSHPFHFSPHGIGTIFLTQTATGIGMLRADPRSTTVDTPAFLHANWIKWGARHMLCAGCTELFPSLDGGPPRDDQDKPLPFMSHLEEPLSGEDHVRRLSYALRYSERIIKPDGLWEWDPELLIWRAMEWVACRSRAWGDDQMCAQARVHMRRTFGVGFQVVADGKGEGEDGVLGMPEDILTGSNVCVVEPPPQEEFWRRMKEKKGIRE